MEATEKETAKLYYSIGEVSQMLAVNSSLIRFWEKEFPVLKPKKNKKGDRLFTVKDIEKLKEIHGLVKGQGFKLAGAKKQLRSKEKIEPVGFEIDNVKAILINAKSKLLALKESLD